MRRETTKIKFEKKRVVCVGEIRIQLGNYRKGFCVIYIDAPEDYLVKVQDGDIKGNYVTRGIQTGVA